MTLLGPTEECPGPVYTLIVSSHRCLYLNSLFPQVSIRRASVISVLITPCLSLLALCFSFLTAVPYISLLLFYSIGALSFLSRLGVYIYYSELWEWVWLWGLGKSVHVLQWVWLWGLGKSVHVLQ